MAKKDLLTENTVRRFMKLADINHLSESFIKEEAYLRDEMPEDDEMPEMPEDDEMPEMPEDDEVPEMPEGEADADEYSEEEEVDKVTFGPEDLEEIFKSFADSVNEIARSKGLPGDMLTVQNEDDGVPGMPEDAEMPEDEDAEMPEDDEMSVGESGMMYETKLAESVASRLAEKFAKSKRAKRAKKRTNISEAEIDRLTENIFRRITNVGKKK